MSNVDGFSSMKYLTTKGPDSLTEHFNWPVIGIQFIFEFRQRVHSGLFHCDGCAAVVWQGTGERTASRWSL